MIYSPCHAKKGMTIFLLEKTDLKLYRSKIGSRDEHLQKIQENPFHILQNVLCLSDLLGV